MEAAALFVFMSASVHKLTDAGNARGAYIWWRAAGVQHVRAAVLRAGAAHYALYCGNGSGWVPSATTCCRFLASSRHMAAAEPTLRAYSEAVYRNTE